MSTNDFLNPEISTKITEITATVEQISLITGTTLTIESLKAADFLGNQPYINDWIHNWLTTMEYEILELPLCVTESIYCDKELCKIYRDNCRQAVMRNDLGWLQNHSVIPFTTRIWNFVDFSSISNELFDFIWETKPTPPNLCDFVSNSRNMHIWTRFTAKYNIDYCVEIAARQKWTEGVKHCVEEGCEIAPILKHCLCSASLFRILTTYNPDCTKEDFQEFILQKMLGRVEDVALVEEYFFTKGFKNFDHNLAY